MAASPNSGDASCSTAPREARLRLAVLRRCSARRLRSMSSIGSRLPRIGGFIHHCIVLIQKDFKGHSGGEYRPCMERYWRRLTQARRVGALSRRRKADGNLPRVARASRHGKRTDVCWAESSKMCNACVNALAFRISSLAAENPMRLSRCASTSNSGDRSDWTVKDYFRGIFFEFQYAAAKAGRFRHRIPGWCPEPDSNRHSLAAEGF